MYKTYTNNAYSTNGSMTSKYRVYVDDLIIICKDAAIAEGSIITRFKSAQGYQGEGPQIHRHGDGLH